MSRGLVFPDSPEWMHWANCRGTDPEAFVPDKGESSDLAKRVCGNCAVESECLEWALVNDERFGVWGGLSERQRGALKKRAV